MRYGLAVCRLTYIAATRIPYEPSLCTTYSGLGSYGIATSTVYHGSLYMQEQQASESWQLPCSPGQQLSVEHRTSYKVSS